jgi:hypothetical protein
MAGMPTAAEILAQLDALISSLCSPSARVAASTWATPLLIDNEEATVATEPRALGPALFLLGAADLLERPPDTYVYQEADFVQARVALAGK